MEGLQMNETISGQVRVPGKLILSGEHSVVYGKQALLMAVNRYTTVKYQCSFNDTGKSIVNLTSGNKPILTNHDLSA